MKFQGKEVKEIRIPAYNVDSINISEVSSQAIGDGESWLHGKIAIDCSGVAMVQGYDRVSLCSQDRVPYREEKKSLRVTRYIINRNAAILFWSDNTKTIVKRGEDEPFNKELAYLYAYFQKTSGMSKTKANKFLKNLEVIDE